MTSGNRGSVWALQNLAIIPWYPKATLTSYSSWLLVHQLLWNDLLTEDVRKGVKDGFTARPLNYSLLPQYCYLPVLGGSVSLSRITL